MPCSNIFSRLTPALVLGSTCWAIPASGFVANPLLASTNAVLETTAEPAMRAARAETTLDELYNAPERSMGRFYCNHFALTPHKEHLGLRPMKTLQ